MTTVLKAMGAGAALAAVVATALATAQTQPPQPGSAQTAGPVDLASAAMGGRVESASSQVTSEKWVPVNVITPNPPDGWGWSAANSGPQELVFSFLTRQAAVVGTMVINPVPKPGEGGAAKDIEIWTSMQGAATGFTRVATASLTPEAVDQAVTFPAVEAKYVKLRILSAEPQFINKVPSPWPARLRRVRILEADRPGYVPMLARNKDLAALARGVIPSAPADASGPLIPADGPACAVPTDTPKKSNFAESQRVLVIAGDAQNYTPSHWKTNRGAQIGNKNDYSLFGRLSFTWITPQAATPALLLPLQQFDTVVFSLVCDLDESVSKEFKQALLAWVAAGHKLIIQDADTCAAATGPRRHPDYSFMPYPFETYNPGAVGAKGEAHLLESSTLISGARNNPHFVDLEAWVKETGGVSNEIGDSNIVVKYDQHWCGAIFARNLTKKNGFLLAYAKFGRGLIIYDGADFDQVNDAPYERLVTNLLAQPFDPDYLPCSQPLGDFVLGTDSGLKTQYMAAGRAYSYPITAFSANGYAGRVNLSASVVPADSSIALKFETPTVTLGEMATTSLSVTTSAGTSTASRVIAVRGKDAAGKSSVMCLALPERKSGSVRVISGLTQDKKPTKNLEIILDASGSMKALLGKQTRWATAQAVLKDVVSKLPKDFSVGLRAYGHTLASTNPGTCKDSALVVAVTPLNPANLLAAAGRLAPRGETPLVYSILQTPADLKGVGGGTVILITDGEESCKGDFAAAAKALKNAGMNLTLNIVGFTLKNAPAQAALSGLAESTGGHYYGASSGDALARAVLLAAVDKLPYRILDAAGKEVAKGEAGVDQAHELAAGNYTVVVTAGEQDVRFPLVVAVGQDITLRALIKGDKLVIER